MTFATGPVSFALSAFSNAALTGLGFLKLCLSKDLWSKQGLVWPGRVLDPETVLVLCFREVALPAPSASPSDPVGPGALPCPVASTHQGTGLSRPPSPHPRPSVFVGHVCAQAMQRPGLCRPRSPRLRARAPSIYGVTPAEGYLLFNLFVEVLPGSPAPPQAPRAWGAGGCVWTPAPPRLCLWRMDLYRG